MAADFMLRKQTCANTTFEPVLVYILISLCSFVSFSARAQTQAVTAFRQSHEPKIIKELVEFLALPNVASDNANIRRNANKIVKMMDERGVKSRLLEHKQANIPPVVFGELRIPGAKETVMFYSHYDGQSADASQWIDADPWQPVLRTNSIENGGKIVPLTNLGPVGPDWRIYARSASDDKSPIVALMTAIDALRAQQRQPTVNLKFLFEGEEEAGSPHLEDILRQNKDLLQADMWITADGPVHQNGQKIIFFGCRGIVSVEITVYGATRSLHSGHYGNWAPNPAMNLSRLLASMKDATGNVLIAGFYDDVEPLGVLEKQAIANSPDYDKKLARELGFAVGEGGGRSLNELINLPSLNVSGLSSGYVGAQARTSVPSFATARVDMRLVKGNDPKRQVERLKEYIRNQGYFVTASDPNFDERMKYPLIAKITTSDGYKAFRTPMNLPMAQKIVKVLESSSVGKFVLMPTVGGSVPLSIFAEITGAPQIGVPIVNYDNNQHGANENVRLQNLWDGIEMFAAIMTM